MFGLNDLTKEKSVIASADKVVDGHFKENAELYEDIIVGLIAPDLPARDRGF